MVIDKLNKEFQVGQQLASAELNNITHKVDEVVEQTNSTTAEVDKVSKRTTDLELKIGDSPVGFVQSVTLFLGANLITSAIADSDWSGDYSSGFSHQQGREGEINFNFNTVEGKKYVAHFILGVAKENTVFAAVGDSYYTDTYNGKTIVDIGFVGNGGKLKIKASTEYNSTVSNITLREVVSPDNAQKTLTLSSYRTSIGQMSNDITGFWNVGIGGVNVMSKLENGSRNVAIGNSAMAVFKSGTRNVAIGTFSMSQLLDGERNIAIGSDSLYFPTHCEDAIAIGKGSMGKMDTEMKYNRSIGIGTNTLSHKNAEDCVVVGYRAGRNIGTNISGCVAIGERSQIRDENALSSSDENVENATAIGYMARAYKSNQVVIGNEYVEELCIGPYRLSFDFESTDEKTVSVPTSSNVTIDTFEGDTFRVNSISGDANCKVSALFTLYNGTQKWVTFDMNTVGKKYTQNGAKTISLRVLSQNVTEDGNLSINYSHGKGIVNWSINNVFYKD